MVFIAAFTVLQEVSQADAARTAADELHDEIQDMILTGTCSDVEIMIPNGYTLTFENNQLKIDGITRPEDGPYSMTVDGPTLGSGSHTLSISLVGDEILVSEVS